MRTGETNMYWKGYLLLKESFTTTTATDAAMDAREKYGEKFVFTLMGLVRHKISRFNIENKEGKNRIFNRNRF